jgi:hypothetical protein
VELTVSPSPSSPERSTIILKNVLHVPTFICNAFGQPLANDNEYAAYFGEFENDKGGILNRARQQIGYFVNSNPLFALAVHAPEGSTLGPTAFKPDKLYYISCRWSDAEKKKWEAHKTKQAAGTADRSEPVYPDWVLLNNSNVQ